ncbi:hypothetical protein V1286_002734 [Bradyrhizobium algeriense]|uniref:Transposase n=1 Tax=Bradyrhizobium algeriense TaxID=634784 RepID=A0ABU8B9J1_9BRAD
MQRVQAARNDYGRFVTAFQTLKSKPSAQEPARAINKPFDRSRTKALFWPWRFRDTFRAEKTRQNKILERDDVSSNRHPTPSLWLEHDLRANAFRVCREGKPVSTFPDHALSGGSVSIRTLYPNNVGCWRPARSWASTAATAVMLSTPRAVTPGVRICAGRAGPIRIGPTGSASASVLIIW